MFNIIYILLLVSLPVFSQNISQQFHAEIRDAMKFIIENEPLINKTLQGTPVEKNLKIAVVFPELLRYSMFRDLFETYAIELGYVNYGASAVDFSIGRFQMKPSFVETIEMKVLQDPSLKIQYASIAMYQDTSLVLVRKERVERLKSIEWQLKYLNCFYDIMLKNKPSLISMKLEEQVRYLATAYNHNFCAPEAEILYWQNQCTFPYGPGYKGSYFSYASVSLYFYITKTNSDNQLKNKQS